VEEDPHMLWTREWRRAPNQSDSGEQKTSPPLEVET